ncbi:MAG: 23S rRNA (guanosine(2251)-2'-O)-methyltransferase RlmB [Candidatus Kapaibacterium sp.]
MEKNQAYIYGRNAVEEAMRADVELEKIYLAFGVKEGFINHIKKLAKKAKVPAVVLDKKKFGDMERDVLPRGAKSQGVLALKSMADIYTVEQLADAALAEENFPVLVALDDISDPHNLGAIARSVECSGAAGIILPQTNSAPLSPAAFKASAGALEHIRVAKCGNLAMELDKLKQRGFWVIGTEMEAEHDYTDNIYDRPVVIIIGSEGKGMRPITKKSCDYLCKIPMKGRLNSLNASVTAGIMLFEILRQRSASEGSV